MALLKQNEKRKRFGGINSRQVIEEGVIEEGALGGQIGANGARGAR